MPIPSIRYRVSMPDRANHLLHVRCLYNLIREFAQSCLAPQKKNRHAEFHAELGFQSRLRLMVNEGVGHVAVGADIHALHLLRLDVVRADEARLREARSQNDLQRRPARAATGIRRLVVRAGRFRSCTPVATAVRSTP